MNVWKKVNSGPILGKLLLIDNLEDLYCFQTGSKAKNRLNANHEQVIDAACSGKRCFVARRNRKDQEIILLDTCEKISISVSSILVFTFKVSGNIFR